MSKLLEKDSVESSAQQMHPMEACRETTLGMYKQRSQIESQAFTAMQIMMDCVTEEL